MRKQIIRLAALVLAAIMLLPTGAQAVYVVGASGSVGSSGTDLNTSGVGLVAQYLQSFRVGLSRDPMGAPLTASDAPDTLKMRLETQYQTRYPDNGYRADNWALTFLPYGHTPTQNAYKRGVAYTEYDPASGDLLIYDDPNIAANTMICSSTKITGSTGVYYPQLKAALGTNTRLDFLKDYWKTVASNRTSSLAYWSYVLEPQGTNNDYSYLVTERVTEKLNPNGIDMLSDTLTEADRIDASLRYIDLLMTLYTLCAADVRGCWETAIDDFLRGEVLGEKPVYLVIDVVHTLTQGASKPMCITSSIDFLQYYCGVDSYNDMTSASFNGSPSGIFAAGQTGTGYVYKPVVGWLKQAVDGSIKNGNNTHRLSSLTKVPSGNAWAWGAPTIVHNGRPTTRSNNSAGGLLDFYYPSWYSAGMEALWFPEVGKIPGFCIIGAEFAAFQKQTVPVDLGFSIKVSPKDKEVTAPIGELASLGENAVIEVDLVQGTATLENWKKRLANIASVDVYMSLREANGHEITCVTDTRFSGVALNGGKVTLAKDEFLSLLSKRLVFEDRVSDLTLPSDSSVEFTYTFAMSVRFTENGDEITTEAVGENSDYASFFRAKDPPVPEYVKYTSSPVTWGEIKQGTIGDEQFEAMAGSPTTRDLYFAVGGSEFIVDFSAELKKEQTAQRTYRVHYDATECEFKEGDQAKSFTFPSAGSGNTTIDSMHDGGTCTVSWTGTTPWTGSGGVSGHIAWATNSWDDSSYNTAMQTAQAYAASVNGAVYSYTAASDGVTRTKSGWGASASGSNPHIGGAATQGQEYIAPTPADEDGNGADPGKPFVAGQYTPGQANTWTITVSWTVPPHTGCGGCCLHDLPAIDDTWTQEITYDYLEIQKAVVWKLDCGSLNGLSAITGADDTVTATVVQGDPTLFYNIAASETSADGRLRYSVEPQQHDAVTWNKGTRTNKCNKQSETWGTGIVYTNAAYPQEDGYLQANASDKDKQTAEYAEFMRNRETLVEATVISDYLILQTSSGDQSVLYYDKKSGAVQTQQDYGKVELTLAEGWDSNPNSAATWTAASINIGSYNGNFADTEGKYSGSGNGNRVATVFDSDPAQTVTRTPRPTAPLHVARYGIGIEETIPNGEYKTGTAKAMWSVVLNYNPSGERLPYSTDGYTKTANYSPTHSKINDILIHNPVSAEYAMLLSLDESRDHRVAAQKGLAVELTQKASDTCPGTPADCEYRTLNCHYIGTSYHTANCYTNASPYTPNVHDHDVGCVDADMIRRAFEPAIYEFSYTGGAQTFTAPTDGTYTLEAWGAQGGGFPNNASDGGYGGYAKSVVYLTKGQQLTVYVGGRGGNAPSNSIDQYDGLNSNGGYNGGGRGSGSRGAGGGGRTDIRYGSGTQDVYVVAAGGGGGYRSSGSSNSSSNGSYFSGSNGKTSRYNSSYPNDNGGGGGGYYGGNTVNGDDPSYGYAGTNYTQGTGAASSYGVRSGNGFARITCENAYIGEAWGLVDLQSIDTGDSYTITTSWLAKQPKDAPIYNCDGAFTRHVCDASCAHTPILKCNEPHHRGEHYATDSDVCWAACGNDHNHALKQSAPSDSTASGSSAGDFINLDWGFQVYFPSIGDFEQGGAYGLSAVSAQRGKGFTDGMDVSEWTADKRVRFNFDVIYCGATSSVNVDGATHGGGNHNHTSACTLYRAGTWIDITADKEYELYNFYCVASNAEAAASGVTFEVTAINAPNGANDNSQPANRLRDSSLRAKHGARKTAYIDVVGRIGNLIMADTGDYRFSNLFKLATDDWYIQGVVKKVDVSTKNYVLASKTDIRGAGTNLNTYGLLPWLEDRTLSFPLSPEKNNIVAYKNQPISFGYPVYLDISTLGKDYTNIEVVPYYYFYDLDTGQVSPLDVYMNTGNDIVPINRFGVVQSGWDKNSVYQYKYALNWTAQSARRNVSTAEASLTQSIVAVSTQHFVDDNGTETSEVMDAPSGNYYALGTAQILSFGERARTFIGSSKTLGVEQNVGGKIPTNEFQKAAKRWHFTLGLPSSAIVVDAGVEPNAVSMAKYKHANGVVLMTAAIRATSNNFTLEYRLDGDSTFTLDGRVHALPSDLPNVIAVYDGNRSSRDDLMIYKTH